jgi:hypothetical protein
MAAGEMQKDHHTSANISSSSQFAAFVVPVGVWQLDQQWSR